MIIGHASWKIILLQISNQQVALSQAEPSRMQNVYLDSSIQNTRLSFTYSADIRVEVTMEDDSADVVITEDPANNRIIADINGTSVCFTWQHMALIINVENFHSMIVTYQALTL